MLERLRELWHRITGADDRPIPYRVTEKTLHELLSDAHRSLNR